MEMAERNCFDYCKCTIENDFLYFQKYWQLKITINGELNDFFKKTLTFTCIK